MDISTVVVAVTGLGAALALYVGLRPSPAATPVPLPPEDAKGKQTGWMASMTNITEAKRVRDQLSASHERFTTVLEGLDAAVSVLSVPGQERWWNQPA